MAVAALSAVVGVLGVSQHLGEGGLASIGLAAAGLGMALAAPLAAWWRCRPSPIELSFETSGGWSMLDAASAAKTPVVLDVMLDLDRWMLLRLRVPGAPRGAGARWMAVGERDLADGWRPFRGAVFGPRGSSSPATALRPPVPGSRPCR